MAKWSVAKEKWGKITFTIKITLHKFYVKHLMIVG